MLVLKYELRNQLQMPEEKHLLHDPVSDAGPRIVARGQHSVARWVLTFSWQRATLTRSGAATQLLSRTCLSFPATGLRWMVRLWHATAPSSKQTGPDFKEGAHGHNLSYRE